MVQFNLLPDVKLEYVKARRTKYMLTMISVVVSAIAIAVLLFSLFMVNVVQKKSLSDLNDDIDTYSQELQDVEDLSKILTVQNQLSTLTELHDGKPVTSRIFTYITQLTPSDVGLTKLSIDFNDSTMRIGGKAPNLDGVSLYATTLKATQYKMDDSVDVTPQAFSDVVLSSFNSEGTFELSLVFDPQIFNALNDVELVVPEGATTSTNVFGVEQ